MFYEPAESSPGQRLCAAARLPRSPAVALYRARSAVRLGRAVAVPTNVWNLELESAPEDWGAGVRGMRLLDRSATTRVRRLGARSWCALAAVPRTSSTFLSERRAHIR